MDEMLDDLETDIKDLVSSYGEDYGFSVGYVETEAHGDNIFIAIKIRR